MTNAIVIKKILHASPHGTTLSSDATTSIATVLSITAFVCGEAIVTVGGAATTGLVGSLLFRTATNAGEKDEHTYGAPQPTHLCIISEATFRAAQSRLAELRSPRRVLHEDAVTVLERDD